MIHYTEAAIVITLKTTIPDYTHNAIMGGLIKLIAMAGRCTDSDISPDDRMSVYTTVSELLEAMLPDERQMKKGVEILPIPKKNNAIQPT